MFWWRRKKKKIEDSPSEDPADRREFRRIKKDLMLSITPVDRPPAMGLSVDVSEGGVRLQCVGVELAVDQLVEIAITAARDTKIFIGRVVRIYDLDGHSMEVGVAFEDVDADDQQFLREHVIES
ncbi:MAG: PilZ domain-containing protein [Acidobacteriota bacterium]|nr:PilZ domain-containing protein [Acidobacteriota bacterium]